MPANEKKDAEGHWGPANSAWRAEEGTWRGGVGCRMLRDRAASINCPVQIADVGHGWVEDPALLTTSRVSGSWLRWSVILSEAGED